MLKGNLGWLVQLEQQVLLDLKGVLELLDSLVG